MPSQLVDGKSTPAFAVGGLMIGTVLLTATATELNALVGSASLDATELGFLDGSAAGTTIASKVVVASAANNIIIPNGSTLATAAADKIALAGVDLAAGDASLQIRPELSGSLYVFGSSFFIGTVTVPTGAVMNVVMKNGATLGAATADIVSLGSVDIAAGEASLQIQPETSGAIFAFGANFYLGTVSHPTALVNGIAIKNGTANSAALTDGSTLYCSDDGATLSSPILATEALTRYRFSNRGAATDPVTAMRYVNTTQVGNVGGGEDDLMSKTLEANLLVADGRGCKIIGHGTTIGTSNQTVKAYWNGVAIMTLTLTALASHWHAEFDVVRTGSGAQAIFGWAIARDTASTSHIWTSCNTTGAATDSGTIIAKFTGTDSGNTTNRVVQDFMSISVYN